MSEGAKDKINGLNSKLLPFQQKVYNHVISSLKNRRRIIMLPARQIGRTMIQQEINEYINHYLIFKK